MTETVSPTKPEIYGIWCLTKKTGVDLSICLVSHSLCLKNFVYCSISLLGIDSAFHVSVKDFTLSSLGKKKKNQWIYNSGLTVILTLQQCLTFMLAIFLTTSLLYIIFIALYIYGFSVSGCLQDFPFIAGFQQLEHTSKGMCPCCFLKPSMIFFLSPSPSKTSVID